MRLSGISLQCKYLAANPRLFKRLSPPLSFKDSFIEPHAKPDQAVHRDTDHKIHQDAAVHLKSLMTKDFRKMRRKRKVVNGVPKQYCQQILQPTDRSDAKELSCFSHEIVRRRRPSQYR